MHKAYLFEMTSVFAKPVTIAFESDELILTGPSPWNILIRFNFIGSIVSIAVKPSIPVLWIHTTRYTHRMKQSIFEQQQKTKLKFINATVLTSCQLFE